MVSKVKNSFFKEDYFTWLLDWTLFY